MDSRLNMTDMEVFLWMSVPAMLMVLLWCCIVTANGSYVQPCKADDVVLAYNTTTHVCTITSRWGYKDQTYQCRPPTASNATIRKLLTTIRRRLPPHMFQIVRRQQNGNVEALRSTINSCIFEERLKPLLQWSAYWMGASNRSAYDAIDPDAVQRRIDRLVRMQDKLKRVFVS